MPKAQKVETGPTYPTRNSVKHERLQRSAPRGEGTYTKTDTAKTEFGISANFQKSPETIPTTPSSKKNFTQQYRQQRGRQGKL